MAVNYKMFLVVIGLTSLTILRFTSVEARLQCKLSVHGWEYDGVLSKTINGRTCQKWSSPTPHSHNYLKGVLFPDNSKYEAKNYCRTPDGNDDTQGPWCYTTDPQVPWEYCKVEPCSNVQCKKTPKGTEYIGSLSKTISGRTCQYWAGHWPHEHKYKIFPEGSIKAQSNHCRNPADKRFKGYGDGPWCYTTDPAVRWEYCDVKLCDT